jgi:hypothetical protein
MLRRIRLRHLSVRAVGARLTALRTFASARGIGYRERVSKLRSTSRSREEIGVTKAHNRPFVCGMKYNLKHALTW